MGPAERHAAALAALDQYTVLARAHTPPEMLAGLRRILVRHRPVVDPEVVKISGYVACDYCGQRWECPDWLDAAGLPDVEGRTL